jgi:hypothetical protein
VYPFDSRLRWHLSDRAGHLVAAFRLHGGVNDSLVQERIRSLARASRARGIVLALLYLGLAGTAVAALARLFPAAATAEALLDRTLAITGSLAGLFTLLALVLTRLLGQLEADLLMLLLLPERGLAKNGHSKVH